MSTVERWYDQHAHLEEHRLDAGRVEFEVTLKTIKKYLGDAKPAKILDIGGGPGRYAIELAKLGHLVTLNDLSSASLEVARVNAERQGVKLDRIIHSNVLDLGKISSIAGERFDLVLCLGPLYHLLEQNERDDALAISMSFLRPGGYLLAAFVSKFAHLRDMARKDPGRLLRESSFYKKYLQNGQYTRFGRTPSYHVSPREVFDLSVVKEKRATLEKVLSCEGFLGFDGAKYLSGLDEDEFNEWMEVIMQNADRPEVLDSADHILAILQKTVDSSL